MTNWERKIIDAFISNYFASVSKTPEKAMANTAAFTGEKRRVLRLRSSVFFPAFDTVSSDEKESYLEAAESLERKGFIKLVWEKRSKGERLKTLSCENFEMLFNEAGRPFPKAEAEKCRDLLKEKADLLKNSPAFSQDMTEVKKVIAFIEFYSIHFCAREIRHGIDQQVIEDLMQLLEFCSKIAQPEKITTRALSILLFRDSKRLENLLALCRPLFSRAEKIIPTPDLSFLERSYPETMISGKMIIEYNDERTSIKNTDGHIFGIPFENAEKIKSIQLISNKKDQKEKTVLTIENKETFYALGSPRKYSGEKSLFPFDCFLYIGGYSNRAAAALIRILAASGFSFYHAGDLDPDGILILQNIQDIAGKPVKPLLMDIATFDQYHAWARTLTKPMLRQIKKIRNETKAIPGLADLLRRIEETGLGVEQEIIDYR